MSSCCGQVPLVDHHLPSDCKEFLKPGSVKGTHWLGWSWLQLEPWSQPMALNVTENNRPSLSGGGAQWSKDQPRPEATYDALESNAGKVFFGTLLPSGFCVWLGKRISNQKMTWKKDKCYPAGA